MAINAYVIEKCSIDATDPIQVDERWKCIRAYSSEDGRDLWRAFEARLHLVSRPINIGQEHVCKRTGNVQG